MAAYPRSFDELYVVSDLHMGGRRDADQNFQIFNQGGRLGKFIEHVAAQRPDGDVALVLNGDVFDSLAEEDIVGGIALNADSATRMMTHLYTDESFAPVWDALAAFVRQPRRHLVFVIGNHDIEIALPVVEFSIRDRLSGGVVDAAARIAFSVHGAGFVCDVGGARVFCTHGNEVDKWNWIDYSALAQLANAMNGGRSIDPSRWKPNAGTQLVVKVMNTVKRQFPFIDLLKPEAAAAAAVLFMLEPSLLEKVDLSSVGSIWWRKREGARVTSDLLGDYAVQMHTTGPAMSTEEIAYELLGANSRALAAAAAGETEDDLLLDVELTRESTPRQSWRPGQPAAGVETLAALDIRSAISWGAHKLGLVSKTERLRRALQDWLANDRTFAVRDVDDETFVAMESRVANSIDFVVTGHTHLARAMTYTSGCHYFNAGTWIRLLRLTDEALDDATVFERDVWSVLKGGRMSALDEAHIPGPKGEKTRLLFDRTNAVRIAAHTAGVSGELLRVGGDAKGITVVREPDTTAMEAR